MVIINKEDLLEIDWKTNYMLVISNEKTLLIEPNSFILLDEKRLKILTKKRGKSRFSFTFQRG